MSRFACFRPGGARSSSLVLGLSMAAVVAGCSADVSRFDAPLGLTEAGKTPGSAPSSYSNPSRPIIDDGVSPSAAPSYGAPGYGGNQSYNSGYGAPPANGTSNGISVASLPPAEQPPPSAPSYAPPQAAASRDVPALRSSAIDSAPLSSGAPAQTGFGQSATAGRGETIQVQPGDTLYGLAHKYKVTTNDFMRANHLTTPNLKPGQKLQLPAGAGTAQAPSAKSAGLRTATAEPAPAAPSDWSGSYAVKAGDNVYGIARAHGTTAAELQRVNGITDVRKLRPGDTLKVPGSVAGETVASARVSAAPTAAPAPATAPDTTTSAGGGSTGFGARPKVLNGPQVAAIESTQTLSDAPRAADTSVAAAASDKLRWPARGRVIANFGTKTSSGRSNDGLNIAVPQGTDVLAAEAGTVTYAASELAEYGNLVVIRHDNGWVTAYAYNDQLLVQRGDRVKRGQPIAKAGKTGVAEQPQVHFELRQNGKPVDPMPFMDKG